MEYSPSCVFPTKLVSEYDDVFLFFFCLKAVLSATRVAKGERIFWYFFFLQPLFYQPEFALFLCDLIFFFGFGFFPWWSKRTSEVGKNSIAAKVVYTILVPNNQQNVLAD